MEVIKFIDTDRVCMFNPMGVKSVEVVTSADGLKWCVDIKFFDGSIKTKLYETKEQADEYAEYVADCLKSIGK